MNDKEFFELLNLYLDHEISTADAARLEAEVQGNRTRRSIYQEYCRMQKACRMIAADFETEPAETAPAGERKIIAFNPAAAKAAAARRKQMAVLYSIGSFAALAACIAVIFVGRGQQPITAEPSPTTIAPVAAAAPAPVAPAEREAVTPVSPIADPDATFVASKSASPQGLVSLAPRPQPVTPRSTLLLYSQSQAENDFGPANDPGDQLSWIPAVKIPPLQQRAATNLEFTSKYGSESRALGNRALGARHTAQPGDEYIGFKLSK